MAYQQRNTEVALQQADLQTKRRLGNEQLLRDKGLRVDILEDQKGIALYAKYRREKPDQDIEDWKGLAEVRRPRT